MTFSVLLSTFLLTLLLCVGLLFFIRASIKERIQAIKLVSEQSEESVLSELQQYFAKRSYRIATIDAEQSLIALEGYVRPSAFLAVFLAVLAAIGLLCIALVLLILFPGFSTAWFGLMFLAPLAGIFYWRGAGRSERVVLQMEPPDNLAEPKRSIITITAHRDELAELQRVFPLPTFD